MPRYLSVEEVAEVLGTTDRTVRRMLNDGRLSGSQHLEKGKMVWRVHATKEILQKLEASFRDSGLTLDGVDEIEDAVMSDVSDQGTSDEDVPDSVRSWVGAERESLRLLAEEMVKPLVETIKEQSSALTVLRNELEEKERQLRLLPDLEKRAEEERMAAEAERKAAQLESLEKEALKKQVAALKEDQQVKEVKLMKVQTLESQVTDLTHELQRLQRPWWKKWFLPRE